VSPPAATAEGLTGALAPVAIKLIDRRSSDATFDRIVMVPTLEFETTPDAHPEQMRPYNGTLLPSRIASVFEIVSPSGPAELDPGFFREKAAAT
jgi:hypothetical protein